MASIDDGLVDSPFGRVSPEILDILNGGQGAPQQTPVAAPQMMPEAPQGQPQATPRPSLQDIPQAQPEARQAQVPTEDDGGSGLDIFREPVDPNSWSSAFGRGVDTLQANFGGTVEAIGEATGSQYLTDAGKQYREQQLKEAAEYGEASTPSFTGINSFDTGLDYFKQTVGSMVPGLGVTAGGMVAGAKAGAAFGVPGRLAGPMIGGFLASMGVNTGALQNEIKELDPNAKAPWVSLAFGAGAGALDTVGLKSLISPMLKWAAPELVYRNAIASGFPKVMVLDALKGAIVETGKGAAIEGGISAAQDVTQGYLAAKVTDHELDANKLLERAGNAFIGGALAGGAIRGGSEILDTVMQNAHAANSGVTPNSGFAQGTKEEGGFLTKIWQMGGREATAPLEPLARTAPAAEEFIRDFRPDMTGEKATGKTVFDDYELRSGKWRSDFSDITHGMDDAQKAALFDEASKPKAQVTDPKAKQLRDLMDQIPQDAKAAGIDNVGYIEGYMPFRPDDKRIVENRAQFEQDIAPYVQDPAQVTQDYLDTISQPRGTNAPQVDRLVQQNPQTGQWEVMKQFTKAGDPNTMRGKFAQGTVPPKFSNLEFSRAFNDVPQEVMNKWSVEQTPKQRTEAINDYFEGAAHRVAFADKFGPSGEKANAQIAKAVAQAQQQGRQVSKAEVDQMYGLLDAYNGMYGRIQSDALRNAQSITSAFLTIKSLPLASLSSLVEFTTPFIRGNVVDALSSVIPAMSQIAKDSVATLFKGSPRSEWSKLAADAGIDFASSQSLLAERLGQTMFNRTAAGLTRRFFLVNGLSALTHVQRTFAAKTGERIYDDAVMRLALGVDPTSAKGVRLLTELRTMGLDIKSQSDAMALWSPSNPSEVAAARDSKALAIRRFTSQAILEPTAADLPLWMSNGRLQLLAQLKRYPTAYSNIILPQLVRKMKPGYQGSYTGAAAAAVGTTFILGAMMTIGYVQDELKQWTKAGFAQPDENRTEAQRFTDVVSQNLLPMQVQYVTNMFAATRHGVDPVSANLGPAAGLIKEAAQAGAKTIGSFEEDPTTGYIWQFMYKQTPFGQYKPGQEAVKDAFSLP